MVNTSISNFRNTNLPIWLIPITAIGPRSISQNSQYQSPNFTNTQSPNMINANLPNRSIPICQYGPNQYHSIKFTNYSIGSCRLWSAEYFSFKYVPKDSIVRDLSKMDFKPSTRSRSFGEKAVCLTLMLLVSNMANTK